MSLAALLELVSLLLVEAAAKVSLSSKPRTLYAKLSSSLNDSERQVPVVLPKSLAKCGSVAYAAQAVLLCV